MTIQTAAKAYAEAQKKRRDVHEYSQKVLAKKFERSVKTISKIANGQPHNVPEDEARLILECLETGNRIKREIAGISIRKICFKHRIRKADFEREIERLGLLEVAA